MHPKLSEQTVKNLAIPDTGNYVTYFVGDVIQGAKAPRGFGVRVTAGGARAFVLNYRIAGRERRYTIGQWPDWSALKAVRVARELRQSIDRGEDPLAAREAAKAPAPTTKTVADLLDDFAARYLQKNALRTAAQVERTLERLVKPAIGSLGIYEIRRSHVVEMLDQIEDENGPVMADRTLAYVRKAFRWHATRDDQFNSPIVAGMARTKPRQRARTRTLTDDEIRAVWSQLDRLGTFGALVKLLTLSAQRLREVALMRRSEIDADGTWTIPANRYKTARANVVPLSKAALAVIEAQPVIDGGDFVLTTNGRTPFSGFSKAKRKLDAMLPASMPPWRLHDIRRTSKTLMVRAGVRPDISERVLGHVIAGVEGVYDQHGYTAEKRDALEKLAAAIERILSPPASNVTPIKSAQRFTR